MTLEDAMTTTRQSRATATRQRIIDAAHDLFVTQGYRSTSLRDIAAAASVSHPGLLGHFASRDDLLGEVVARFEQATADAMNLIAAAVEPGALVFAEVATRNARTPGYLELFAALTGEASTPAHPAHARMRERYADMRGLAADILQDAADHGVISPDRDIAGETVRMIAGWDGLQLMTQYLPDRVDVVEMLEEREALWALPRGWRDDHPPAPATPAGPLPEFVLNDPVDEPEGYASGRRRRAQILADATELFARSGYGDTSLRDIADAVGVTKSTLLHHYPSKEALLGAVVRGRDDSIHWQATGIDADRAADMLRALPAGAARNAAEAPGLIEVYAVLSCEAVPASHPAHEHFAGRFTRALDHFTELFRLARLDGDLPEHRVPAHEALWLIAMWDGLQYQWLYDRESIDVTAHLEAHLQDVLPPR